MTEIVRDGYERMGDAFADWRDLIVDDPRTEWRDNSRLARAAGFSRSATRSCAFASRRGR
ncbi:MAG: hypothetical protein ACYDCH_14820 [Gaiellaceae bacterium]